LKLINSSPFIIVVNKGQGGRMKSMRAWKGRSKRYFEPIQSQLKIIKQITKECSIKKREGKLINKNKPKHG